MAIFITVSDIRKFEGQKEVDLPSDTKLTPAAEDWAKAHHLQVNLGVTNKPSTSLYNQDQTERVVLLKRVIEAVIGLNKKGKPYQKEELFLIVEVCLKRLGHRIEG